MTEELIPRSESDSDGPSRQAEGNRVKLARLFPRVVNRQLLGVLLAISVLGHGIGYLHHRLTMDSARGPAGPEVSLGRFRFVASSSDGGPVTRADFALHVSLLSQVDSVARARLASFRYRVQQGVEQLLRRAHSADFADPTLGELKRRLQEEINQTIGLRAVGEVIVTQVSLVQNPQSAETVAETAGTVPWVERPAHDGSARESCSGFPRS
jgi:hypothetical protein